MPHIELNNNYPGIRGLLTYRPEIAGPVAALTQVLLHAPHPTLSAGERELIAAYVSALNECKFCTKSHAAIAKHYLGDANLVNQVIDGAESAPVSGKMKALLKIAGAVQSGGKNVAEADVELARSKGATDLEIHDTVLIAATFCMFNRYVDGLATWQPDDDESYIQAAEHRAKTGYTLASLNVNSN
jgi:uncharacterized peroxidase-related enzyme